MGLKQVGAYMRRLRDLMKLTQADIASAVGVDERTIRQWEKGENKPSLEPFLKYLLVTGGSIKQIVALLQNDTLSTAEARRIADVWADEALQQAVVGLSNGDEHRARRLHGIVLLLRRLSKDELLELLVQLELSHRPADDAPSE